MIWLYSGICGLAVYDWKYDGFISGNLIGFNELSIVCISIL
jgi:hypothetical protein